jgi:UPF0716 protein FxsA
MFGILALLFILIPAIEIYLLIEIGSFIGGFNTILIVVVTGIVGAGLAKAQGLAVLNKVQTDLNGGKLPADQIIHGLLVFGGGLLLLTPGFLTDILGFSMVAPGSRHLIVAWAKQMFQKGIESGNIKFGSFGSFNQQGGGGFQSYTYYSSSEDFKDPFNQEPRQEVIEDENVIEVDFEEKK